MKILEFINVILKNKLKIFSLSIVLFLITYLLIYFFIDPEYEATVTLMPSEDSQQLGGVSSLLKNIGNLPMGLGANSKIADTGLYTTIILSRNTLFPLIYKYNLIYDYDIDTSRTEWPDIILKKFKNNIEASLDKNYAYKITVTSTSPQKAADIANELSQIVNSRIIELKIIKAKSNKEFLEKRIIDVKNKLHQSEDKMREFQTTSNFIEIKEQLRGIVSTYNSLENELLTKKIQYEVFEKLNGSNSPKNILFKEELSVLETNVLKIKKEGLGDGIIPAVKDIPQKTIDYIRFYREVQTYQTILEFILPLYEQAKFEEQKQVPILQIIDPAIAPTKRSFPARILLTLAIIFPLIIFYIVILTGKENGYFRNNPEITELLRNITR
ncbi:MAG: hypothetical protein L6Q77_02445 [Bacteroidetes bacterium]|nr:hypothetical protein [Bacteroidota bacterium]